MRLPANGFRRALFALGLSVTLAACGRGGDVEFADNRPAAASDVPGAGASADYPITLGDPYTVDGQVFAPEDSMNVDEVGYAGLDNEGGQGVSIAHRTMPLPSYAELTSLDTGKTILARVERRGPMTTSRLVSLSPGAAEQLGVRDGSGVRVRRVNPPEAERAALRSGNPATARLDTPMSLVEVLRERLPANGSVSLASGEQPPMASGIASAPSQGVEPVAVPPSTAELPQVAASTPAPTSNSSSAELPPVAAAPAKSAPVVAPPPAPVTAQSSPRFEQAFSESRRANTKYPLAPLTVAEAAPVVTQPVVVRGTPGETYSLPPSPGSQPVRVQPAVARSAPPPQPAPAAAPSRANGRFVIQAGAYSSQANANRAANSIGGFVERSGRFYRVRTGPYATRGQAEAALAKVRAAGYRDARVFTAG